LGCSPQASNAIAAARLHHPNVVGVYDRFIYRGDAYIATEYVDGLDLAGILSSENRLPWRIGATIALELARGLEAIHDTGTLHRDIKPQNILVGRHGEVKITDFGLALDASGAALTQPGIAVGTPPYMAPEQLRGERVDPRADLFSFGCVLYEMLVGRPPFSQPGPEDGAEASLLARVESGRYTRIRGKCRDAPRALVRLVRHCLRPRAPRRVASAMEVRRRLETLLGRPSSADCQSSLAAFLWDRHVFESRSTETVVMVARPAATVRARPLRMALAAVAMTLSLGFLAISIRDPASILRWTDVVLQAPDLALMSVQSPEIDPVAD
jgi:serine/threonine protein kinase